MKRQLNFRLLGISLAILVGLAVAVHFLHEFQVQRNAKSFLDRADALLEKKEYAKALNLIFEYRKIKPQDPSALEKYAMTLGELARTPEDHGRVVRALQELSRRGPLSTETRHQLMLSLIQQGNTKEALAQARLLPPDFKEPGELEHLQGWLHEANKDFDKAVEWFQRAYKLNPKRIESYSLSADILHEHLLQDDLAEGILDQMIEANPKNPAAYLARYRFRRTLQKQDEAKKDLDAATALAPDNVDVIFAAVEAALSAGKAPEALAILTRGVEKHPKQTGLVANLADLQLRSGQRSQAITTLEKGIAAAKETADTSDLEIMLVDLLLDDRKATQAQEWVRKLRARNGTTPQTQFLESRLLVDAGKTKEALKLLEKVQGDRNLPNEWLGRVEALLGFCYGQVGDSENQLLMFRRVLDREPNWTAPRFGLGAALLQKGDWNAALTELGEVSKQPDAPPETWLLLARALYQQQLHQPVDQRNWAVFEKALDRAERQAKQPLEVTLLKADYALFRKDSTAAGQTLLRAVQDHPRDVNLRIAFAEFEAKQARVNQGLQVLSDARTALGDSVELRLAQLRILAGRADPDDRKQIQQLGQEVQTLSSTDKARLYRALGETFFQLGDGSQADQYWLAVIREIPGDLESRIRRFELSLRERQFGKAQEILNEIGTLEGPQGSFHAYGKASLVVAGGGADRSKLQEARASLAALPDKVRHEPRVLLLQAKIGEWLGNYAEALTLYTQAIQRGERDPRLVVRTAQMEFDRGRFAEAGDVLKVYEEKTPLNGEMTRLAIEIALANQNYRRARALVEPLLATASRDYRDYLWLGRICQEIGEYDMAEKHLRRAVALAEHTPETWAALIRHLQVFTRIPRAIDPVLRDLIRKVAPARRSFFLARCYEAAGDFEHAERVYQEALAARPNDFMILEAAADFFRTRDLPERAEPLYQKIVARDTSAPSEILARARRWLALLGSPTQAHAMLEANRSRQEIVDERIRQYLRGQQPGQRAEVIRWFEESFTQLPASADERFLLIQLLDQAGEVEKARDRTRELLLRKETAQYLAYFGRLLVKNNNLAEAETVSNRLAILEPAGSRIRELKTALEAAKSKAVTTP